MDLVDEEDGARAEVRGLLRLGHHLLDLLDAGEYGGELDEAGLSDLCDDLGQRGFADAGRSPEDHRGCIVPLNLQAKRLAGTEEMLLANKLIQRARAHALGQRSLARRRRTARHGRCIEEAHSLDALCRAAS